VAASSPVNQSRLGGINRQSKIGNSSRVSSADIRRGRNPNRGGTLPLPSIRRNFTAVVTLAIPAQDSAWEVTLPRQTRIKLKGRRLADHESCEVTMARVKEEVVLSREDHAGNLQNR